MCGNAEDYILGGGHRTENMYAGWGGHRKYFLDGANEVGEKHILGEGDIAYILLIGTTTRQLS